VSVNAPATSGAPDRGVVFVFVDSINLCFIDNSISPLPLAMPEGGDGAACPAALPGEGQWVPTPLLWQGNRLRRRLGMPLLRPPWVSQRHRLLSLMLPRPNARVARTPSQRSLSREREVLPAMRMLEGRTLRRSSSSGLRALWVPASARQGKREGLVVEPWQPIARAWHPKV
jgi:hypothetical protein